VKFVTVHETILHRFTGIVVQRPLTPQDLLATIDRYLGIDHRAEFRDFSGRPIRILPDGEPIRELI
jgi:hypothetical protein